MEKRSFKFLKETMSEHQLASFCRLIVMEFLRITNGHPRTFIGMTYWISDECYYDCLKYAITHWLVTEAEVDRMEERAIYNQRKHAETNASNTKKNYLQLRKERMLFEKECEEGMSDEKKISLAKKYVEKVKLSTFELALREGIPYPVVSRSIETAIVKNLVNDKLLAKIEAKEWDRSKHKRETIERFLKYREERTKNSQQ